MFCKSKQQDVDKSGYLIMQSKFRDAKNIAVVIPCFGMKPEEYLANARMLCAAPIMYQALLMFKKSYSSSYDSDENHTIDLQKYADAIQLCEKALREADFGEPFKSTGDGPKRKENTANNDIGDQ